jgi:ribosome production factor 1
VRPRKIADIKSIIKGGIERGYTDIVVVNEDRKKPTGIVISHLPDGKFYKLESNWLKIIINPEISKTFYPTSIVYLWLPRRPHPLHPS